MNFHGCEHGNALGACPDCNADSHLQRIAELEAQNARLREALNAYLDTCEAWGDVRQCECECCVPARAALSTSAGRELQERVGRLEAEVASLAEWHSLCVECGPNVGVDEDGLCATCGVTATGAYLDTMRVELERAFSHVSGRYELAMALNSQLLRRAEAAEKRISGTETHKCMFCACDGNRCGGWRRTCRS